MTTAHADEGTIRCLPRIARSPRAESRGVPAARPLLATALAVALCTTTAAEAAFVRYVVTAVDVAHEGKELTVYTVAARFDGAADTVLLAHQLKSADPAMLKGFWHKDSATLGDAEGTAPLSQDAGTWNPAQTVQPKQNRGLDSYLTIGGECGGRNATSADPSWTRAEKDDTRGWSRPDLPASGRAGWFLAAMPGASAGRVGGSAAYEIGGTPTLENAATDVRLAQFVLSRGHAPREFELTVAYNAGKPGEAQVYATATFTLGGATPAQAAPESGAAKDGAARDGTARSGAPGDAATPPAAEKKQPAQAAP